MLNASEILKAGKVTINDRGYNVTRNKYGKISIVCCKSLVKIDDLLLNQFEQILRDMLEIGNFGTYGNCQGFEAVKYMHVKRLLYKAIDASDGSHYNPTIDKLYEQIDQLTLRTSTGNFEDCR